MAVPSITVTANAPPIWARTNQLEDVYPTSPNAVRLRQGSTVEKWLPAPQCTDTEVEEFPSPPTWDELQTKYAK